MAELDDSNKGDAKQPEGSDDPGQPNDEETSSATPSRRVTPSIRGSDTVHSVRRKYLSIDMIERLTYFTEAVYYLL